MSKDHFIFSLAEKVRKKPSPKKSHQCRGEGFLNGDGKTIWLRYVEVIGRPDFI